MTALTNFNSDLTCKKMCKFICAIFLELVLISDILNPYFRRFFRYCEDKVLLVFSVLFGADIHTRISFSYDKASANPPGFLHMVGLKWHQ